MDQFTQIALARSRSTATEDFAVFTETEVEKGPITLEEKLLFAYPTGVPQTVARMLIDWRLPDGRDDYQTHQAAMAIYHDLEARALAANKRLPEIIDRLAELERQLVTLRAEYAGLLAQIKGPTPLHLTPREVGLREVDQAGCVKLIAALEAEIERLRPEPARARKEYEALWPLARLAGVVAGHLRRETLSPKDFGFEYEWQICAAPVRRQREKEHREQLERERAEREQKEREWEERRPERERREAELAEAERARRAEEAWIDSLSFEGLIAFLFFEGQELTLAEVKRQVSGWGHYHLVKAAVSLWPERPHPDLWITTRDEINGISAGRDKLFRRAADRLAQILHPGYAGDVVLPSQTAEDLHEAAEPTYDEIDRMDFDSLMGFVFAGKPKALDSMPTLKAMIAARPDLPASNTVRAAMNELLPIGVTESVLYNYALQRLSTLITSREEPQSP